MDPTVQAQLIDLAKLVLPVLIAVCGTLGGGYLGHRYAKVQSRHSKALDFIERRVTEFYSPMVGCIKSIRALSELRVEVSNAAEAAWHEICARAPTPFLNHDKHFEPFKGIVGYENEQLYRDILPTYERMIQIFIDHYWLADDEARKYYPELVRFCRTLETVQGGRAATRCPSESRALGRTARSLVRGFGETPGGAHGASCAQEGRPTAAVGILSRRS
jgi:hypothetical protein